MQKARVRLIAPLAAVLAVILVIGHLALCEVVLEIWFIFTVTRAVETFVALQN